MKEKRERIKEMTKKVGKKGEYVEKGRLRSIPREGWIKGWKEREWSEKRKTEMMRNKEKMYARRYGKHRLIDG